jgi:hypothetical protein
MLTSLKFCFRQETHSPHDINGLKNKLSQIWLQKESQERGLHIRYTAAVWGKQNLQPKYFIPPIFHFFGRFHLSGGPTFSVIPPVLLDSTG